MSIVNVRMTEGKNPYKLEFYSAIPVRAGEYFQLTFDNKVRDLKVEAFEIEDNEFKVTLVEAGYYANQLKEIPNLDPRKLLGLQVTKIEDVETIKGIRERSGWL